MLLRDQKRLIVKLTKVMKSANLGVCNVLERPQAIDSYGCHQGMAGYKPCGVFL